MKSTDRERASETTPRGLLSDKGKKRLVRRGTLAAVVAAWALLALVPSAGATPPASQAAIWSATLTVADAGSGQVGCMGDSQCASSLSENWVGTGKTWYSIRDVQLHTQGTFAGTLILRFVSSPYGLPLDDVLRGSNFCVGSTAFAIPDSPQHFVMWTDTGLSWSVGDQVPLSLGDSCPEPSPPVPTAPAANSDSGTAAAATTTETVRIKQAKIEVGEAGGTIRVTRSGDTARAVEATLAYADGTATSPDDYRGVERTVTIPAGKRSRDVRLPIVDDKIDEDNEQFTVTLTSNTGGYAAAGDPTVVTIADDDTAGVKLSKTDVTASEADKFSYKIKLTSKPAADVTITVTSGDPDKATVGRDASRSRTFTPDNWKKAQKVTIRVRPVGENSVAIAHTATSDDPHYNNIAITPVTITIEARPS